MWNVLVDWKISNLNLNTKRLVYQFIIRPIWTYGVQLWGCALNNYLWSNVAKISSFFWSLIHIATWPTKTDTSNGSVKWFVISSRNTNRDWQSTLIKKLSNSWTTLRSLKRLNKTKPHALCRWILTVKSVCLSTFVLFIV